MNTQWVWLAAILGVAAALPMKSHRDPEQLMRIFQVKDLGRNNAIETLIIDALEDLRQTMLTGSDDIPVLDPLEVEHLFADDSVIPIPGAHVEVNNMVVTKLSTFELQEVSVESTNILLQRYRARIQAEIPLIDVDVGGYDLLIHIWGLDIFGKGDAKISVTKPWIGIDTNVNIRLGWLAMYLNIMDLRLSFGLSDIQFGINGMFNDPSVDDFISRFLRNLIMELAEFWADDLSDIISPIVMDVANDILSDINIIGLIP